MRSRDIQCEWCRFEERIPEGDSEPAGHWFDLCLTCHTAQESAWKARRSETARESDQPESVG